MTEQTATVTQHPRAFTHEVTSITPGLAAHMLSKNNHNRHVRSGKVDAFARDMTHGRWVLNGEAIQIAVDGTILNGQHRLLAVVKSGCTVPFLVVSGLPITAQDTIDIGAKRSLGDSLSLRGEVQPNLLAAITRRAAHWDAGVRAHHPGRAALTDQELRDYLEANPLLRFATQVAGRSQRYVQMPGSALGLVFFLCARVDREAAVSFFVDQITEGIGVGWGTPARALRQRLMLESEKRRGGAHEVALVGYALRAWNAFRSGETLSHLMAPKGGWSSANLPDPV